METVTAWRLTREKYVDTAFTGDGARLYGSRFNSKGTRVVYTAENLPLALLETIVGLTDYNQLFEYVFFRVELPAVGIEIVTAEDLPSNWNVRTPGASTKRIGDRWIQARDSLILGVPSVVVPYSCNYLINPAHPDFETIEILPPEKLPVDERLVAQ